MKNIKQTITEIINGTEIFDIHTHLFPSEFKKYHLSGISEVLNYHYLIAELLTTTNINVKNFYKLTLDWTPIYCSLILCDNDSFNSV